MTSEAEAWRATNSKKRMALKSGICANSSEEVCSTCLTNCRTDFVFGIASRSPAAPRVEEESRDLERAKIRRVSAKLRTWASQDAPGIGHVSSNFKPCWRRGRHGDPGLGVR